MTSKSLELTGLFASTSSAASLASRTGNLSSVNTVIAIEPLCRYPLDKSSSLSWSYLPFFLSCLLSRLTRQASLPIHILPRRSLKSTSFPSLSISILNLGAVTCSCPRVPRKVSSTSPRRPSPSHANIIDSYQISPSPDTNADHQHVD